MSGAVWPVTRDWTIQNSESMPMVTSMKKNTTAHIDPPGNFNTTWVNGIVREKDFKKIMKMTNQPQDR